MICKTYIIILYTILFSNVQPLFSSYKIKTSNMYVEMWIIQLNSQTNGIRREYKTLTILSFNFHCY